MRQAGSESINQSINQSVSKFLLGKDASFDLHRTKVDPNLQATTYQGSKTK